MPIFASDEISRPMPRLDEIAIDSVQCGLHRSAGFLVIKTIEPVGTSGAASYDLFNVIGAVQLLGIWGVFTDVTNVAAITAASFDFDDGAETVQITSAAGVALSGATVGSSIQAVGDNTQALSFSKADQVRVAQGITGPKALEETFLTAKTATTCQVRFTCTTGAVEDFSIICYMAWRCMDTGSSVAAV